MHFRNELICLSVFCWTWAARQVSWFGFLCISLCMNYCLLLPDILALVPSSTALGLTPRWLSFPLWGKTELSYISLLIVFLIFILSLPAHLHITLIISIPGPPVCRQFVSSVQTHFQTRQRLLHINFCWGKSKALRSSWTWIPALHCVTFGGFLALWAWAFTAGCWGKPNPVCIRLVLLRVISLHFPPPATHLSSFSPLPCKRNGTFRS